MGLEEKIDSQREFISGWVGQKRSLYRREVIMQWLTRRDLAYLAYSVKK